MSEMVERVARAAYLESPVVVFWAVVPFDKLTMDRQEVERARARASIAALRQLPENPDIPACAPWAFHNGASHDEHGNAIVTRADWSAMIDAALAE